jgi:two-component system nitrogen regulation sensor histidine kinase GlnL
MRKADAQAIGGRRTAGGTRSAMGAAAMLAHEIKNPLSGIRGAAQLLSGTASDTDAPLTRLDLRRGRPHRGIDRPDAGFHHRAPAGAPRPTSIRCWTARSASSAQAWARMWRWSANMTLRCPPAKCNADALTQIVLNLLKNACEAARGGVKPSIRIDGVPPRRAVMAGEGKGNAVLPSRSW